MFDLFRSRDKAVRIFLTVLLSLVALSMVAYLIPGYGGSGPTASDNVVADVGKNHVTVHDVQMAVRAATRVPPEARKGDERVRENRTRQDRGGSEGHARRDA